MSVWEMGPIGCPEMSVRKMGPIGCPETSVTNYHYNLEDGAYRCPEMSVINYHYKVSNNPEERSFHLLRGGSLKSHMFVKNTTELNHVKILTSAPSLPNDCCPTIGRCMVSYTDSLLEDTHQYCAGRKQLRPSEHVLPMNCAMLYGCSRSNEVAKT